MWHKKIFSFFVLVFLIYLINENSLYPYINKGSGSDFFQLFLSFFVAIGSFFKNIFSKNKNSKDKYE